MSMSQYLTKEDMYKDQLKQIADALGTAEDGDALIEVARNAHRAEMAAAKAHKILIDADKPCANRVLEAVRELTK